MTSIENTNTFGFWESPMIKPGTIQAGGLAVATYRISSSLASAASAPTIRMRTSAASFQRSDVLVATSIGTGTFSPDRVGRTYRHFFNTLPGEDIRVNLDLLNVDPTDAANASVTLEDLAVQAVGPLQGERAEASVDLGSNQAAMWQQVTAAPFAAPTFGRGGDGISLDGGAAPAGTTVFGFWTSPPASPFLNIERGRLYRFDFTVTSTATAGNVGKTPAFRLRLNDTTLRSSAYVNVESAGDNSVLPAAGTARTYSLWYEGPNGLAGSSVLLAFDFLLVGELPRDPLIRLTLTDVVIRSYNEPPAP